MSLFKALILSKQTKVFLKTQTPLYKGLLPPPPFIIRTFNSSPDKLSKKPLSLLFQEAVDLTEKTGGNESQGESGGEDNELLKELKELEREFRKLKENPRGKGKLKAKAKARAKEKQIEEDNENEKPKEEEGVEREKPKKSLVELFSGAKKKERVKEVPKVRSQGENIKALKDFSQIAEIFIRHLYAKGYFNKANFLVDNKLDFGYFDNSYSRDFIKFAAYKFGNDHQEIAKWLSGNHLKKVVLFGCPSLEKNNIYAAKRMRKFFKIQENTVCSQCALKDSCKYANKDVFGVGTENLLLVDVMKVIALYVLDQVHATLKVPDEVNDSVRILLKEVIRLTKSM